jgi:O-antigen/teichoic acid export membrane protein
MAETLKEKTAKGLFWGAMNNGAMQVIGLIFGIVLGRLLSKEDYGMMAMINVFPLIAIALQNSGFASAIGNLKHPTANDYNSVFWFNIIVGSSLYVILFFCAPFIADFYHDERLVSLCRLAFINILFSSLGTAQAAFLFKNMMVKQQAKASITAVLLSSSVGVLMAWNGFAYWSLAAQGVVYVGISKGKSGAYFWCTVSLSVTQIVLMLLLWPYGIHLMVSVYVALTIVWMFVWYALAYRYISYRPLDFLKDTCPFLLAALGVMSLTYLATMSITNLVCLLLARVVMAAVLYFVVMKVARVAILDECIRFVFKKNR